MHFTTTFAILLSATTVLALPGKPQPQQNTVAKTDQTSSDSSGDDWPVWFGVTIDKPPSGKFTGISATLKVPTLKLGDQKGPNGYGVSAWIGLDGAKDSDDVLQVGVNMFITSDGAKLTVPDGDKLILRGVPEWYPTPFTEWAEKELKIVYGDVIKLRVESTSETAATLYIENTNTGVKISKPMTPPKGTKLIGNTAEWIVESLIGPDGKFLPPPDFGTIAFSDCVATTSDGKTYGPDAGKVFDQGDKLKTETKGNTVNVNFVPESAFINPGKPGGKKKPPAESSTTGGTAHTGQ
ncbi:peptidase A4 family-domain-containing protein [Phyllosticta citribraziliensis]